MSSSARSGPKALATSPATPMMPIDRARLAAGAKSEQTPIVAVMPTPQPTPETARRRRGNAPASLNEMEQGDGRGEDDDAPKREPPSPAAVDGATEDRARENGEDAVDPHDEPDPALGRAEPPQEKGQEEEHGHGHVEEEVAEQGDDEVPVPERLAARFPSVHQGPILGHCRSFHKPRRGPGIREGEVMLAVRSGEISY